MIVFRVDSSAQIGSGHLMRCLTLAGQLRNSGQADIRFISRDLEGNLNHLISDSGYSFYELPCVQSNEKLVGYEKWLTVSQLFDVAQVCDILQSIGLIDCLIIDSYAVDEQWEKEIRPYVKKIMVIDDLANRKHDCDILLDQNYQSELGDKYQHLVPINCRLFLGIKYVLLRDEFYVERKQLRIRDGSVKNILVFFGGSDDTNETEKVLKGLQRLQDKSVQVTVIVGQGNANKRAIEGMCNKDGFNYYCQIENMAQVMQNADLAFGAGGSNTWERCFLGLPAIVTVTAENQRLIAEKTAQTGAVVNLGNHHNIDSDDYWRALTVMNQEELRKMSRAALNLIQGTEIMQVVNAVLASEEVRACR